MLKFLYFPFYHGLGGGTNTISVKRLVEILRRRSKLREEEETVVNKLKEQKKLTSDEFWLVYNSIWQEGPEVKYRDPHKWINGAKQR